MTNVGAVLTEQGNPAPTDMPINDQTGVFALILIDCLYERGMINKHTYDKIKKKYVVKI